MVKNKTNSSIHSLRGSQSVQTLRHSSTPHLATQLEAARQKIQDLEDQLNTPSTAAVSATCAKLESAASAPGLPDRERDARIRQAKDKAKIRIPLVEHEDDREFMDDRLVSFADVWGEQEDGEGEYEIKRPWESRAMVGERQVPSLYSQFEERYMGKEGEKGEKRKTLPLLSEREDDRSGELGVVDPAEHIACEEDGDEAIWETSQERMAKMRARIAAYSNAKKMWDRVEASEGRDAQENWQKEANEYLHRYGITVTDENKLKSAEEYCQPFCEFLTENPTVFHAVDYFEKKLNKAGFTKLSERKTWTDILKTGGKYYVSRNGSSLIAFTVGSAYKSGNGVAMVGGHIDALTAKLKPISNKKTSAGYTQLGVAPYAGALNSTWWDRDLGIGGRVLVKDSKGKITTKLVKLGWPIARIPTLAPHFGVGMTGSNNKETQTVPIIGLDSSPSATTEEFQNLTLGEAGTFVATQPPKLVRAIAGELSITDYSSIVNWELELYDTQPAQIGGLDKEFIFGGRIDDKVCSWAAVEGLLAASSSPPSDDGIIKLVGVFDDEEIGSQLRQGAKSNFLPGTIERIAESFAPSGTSANVLSQTYANSFLISADVTHAVNPNFLDKYLENHAPRLNVGLTIAADSNGHMTTDSVSTALLARVAEKTNNKIQVFMIRNDSRSGGTIGPELSSTMGVRAIDAGIAQLSMHSIRATIGNLDPGLGVRIFAGFFEEFESVDREFE